jgi:ABC-type nitrate/sulfonate/bicarbonate transport system substrate-binding protein
MDTFGRRWPRRGARGRIVAAALLGAMAAGLAGAAAPAAAQEPPVPTIPRVTVRYAHAAFLDQSEAILGIRKGWFEEVGIELHPKPHGLVLPSAERAANLIAGNVDVVATGVYNLLPAMGKARNLRVFFQKDIFRGYRLMAQPGKGYKSLEDFTKEGLSAEEAFRRTAQQLKGKTITYLSEPSRQQFIEMIYRRGGLTKADTDTITTINVDDNQTIAMMVSGRADFQFSGAPAMVELTRRGFKPIVTAFDLARTARPTADSEELLAILKVGWGTTAEWLEKNRETALRMAGVGFRIAKFIREQPEEALAMHVPFLNSIAGSQMTTEFGKWLYDVVHPYYTFEDQADWYENPQSVFYYPYEVGARIKDAEKKGIFKPGEMTVDTIHVADDFYRELKELRAKAAPLIAEARDKIGRARQAGKDAGRAQELLQRAEQLFAGYAFLDAHRFAQAAVAWADHAARR